MSVGNVRGASISGVAGGYAPLNSSLLVPRAYLPIGGHFLHSTKSSADTPDDEFPSSSLDGKWTVLTGTNSAVSFLETGNVAKYDLATRPGCLLIQVGSAATQEVELRQDYTLPDGSSIIMAISPGLHYAALTGDELQIGMGFNSDNTGYDAGSTHFEWYAVEVDSDPDIQATPTGHSGGQGSVTVNSARNSTPVSRTIFLRMSRSGLTYYPSFSFDGHAWSQLGGSTFAAAHDNVWIFARAAGATGTPVPIHTVHWVRLGSNAVDPWDWY